MLLLYRGLQGARGAPRSAIDCKDGIRVPIENVSALCAVSLPMQQNQFCFLAGPERSDRRNIRAVKKDLRTIFGGRIDLHGEFQGSSPVRKQEQRRWRVVPTAGSTGDCATAGCKIDSIER